MKNTKLKLTALSDAIMKDKEMSAILGGNCCTCSCYWEGKGGSSVEDNKNANYAVDGYSVNGCNGYWACDDGYTFDVDSSWLHE